VSAAKREHCEVGVVGGGPAGATVARLLASWGRDVVLFDRRAPAGVGIEETIVASARPLLERLGLVPLLERLECAGPPRRARVWGESRLQVRDDAPLERGFEVERGSFDRALVRFAEERGARVVSDASARFESGESALRVVTAAGASAVECNVVVLATGRASHEALATDGVLDALPESLALSRRIARPTSFADTACVEALPQGWSWWLPARGAVSLTLFVDREECLARGREELWSEALADSIGPARGVSGPPERGTTASPRLRQPIANALLAGDAASMIDPLSSQGLEKAFASAEHAALCANTMLARPELREHLFAHHASWERRLYAAHRAQTLAFYRAEPRFREREFWRKRQAVREERLDRPPLEMPPRVRRSPSVWATTTFEPRGERLAEVAAIRLESADSELTRLAAVSAEAWLELAEPSASIDECIARAARDGRFHALRPSQVRAGLAELLALGFLAPDQRV
jgi:flavin-dependent dehydrogenase